jgi:hypothetical protein
MRDQHPVISDKLNILMKRHIRIERLSMLIFAFSFICVFFGSLVMISSYPSLPEQEREMYAEFDKIHARSGSKVTSVDYVLIDKIDWKKTLEQINLDKSEYVKVFNQPPHKPTNIPYYYVPTQLHSPFILAQALIQTGKKDLTNKLYKSLDFDELQILAENDDSLKNQIYLFDVGVNGEPTLESSIKLRDEANLIWSRAKSEMLTYLLIGGVFGFIGFLVSKLAEMIGSNISYIETAR